MSISVTCPTCEATFQVRDELAGRNVKCPKHGGVIAVPADSEPPAEEGRDPRRSATKKSARQSGQPAREDAAEGAGKSRDSRAVRKMKRQRQNIGVVLFLVGGFVLLLMVGGVVAGIILFLKHFDEDGPKNAATVAPGTPGATVIPEPPAALVDEKKLLAAGQEWVREVDLKTPGRSYVRVQGSHSFSVTILTAEAYRAMRANKDAVLKKDDILLTVNEKGLYHGNVIFQSGSSFFIIKNKSDKAVEFRIECYPPR